MKYSELYSQQVQAEKESQESSKSKAKDYQSVIQRNEEYYKEITSLRHCHSQEIEMFHREFEQVIKENKVAMAELQNQVSLD